MGVYKIFSLEGCPYSRDAEQLFKNSSAKYEIIKVLRNNKTEFQRTDKNPMRTFPQIFYERNKDFIIIGGFDNMEKLVNNTPIQFFKDPKYIKTKQVLEKSIKRRFKE